MKVADLLEAVRNRCLTSARWNKIDDRENEFLLKISDREEPKILDNDSFVYIASKDIVRIETVECVAYRVRPQRLSWLVIFRIEHDFFVYGIPRWESLNAAERFVMENDILFHLRRSPIEIEGFQVNTVEEYLSYLIDENHAQPFYRERAISSEYFGLDLEPCGAIPNYENTVKLTFFREQKIIDPVTSVSRASVHQADHLKRLTRRHTTHAPLLQVQENFVLQFEKAWGSACFRHLGESVFINFIQPARRENSLIASWSKERGTT